MNALDEWASLGFPRRVASQWQAAGVTPEEAEAWAWLGLWANGELVDAAPAIRWRELVATPDEAEPWWERSIGPWEAERWVQAGWTAAEAIDLMAIYRPSGLTPDLDAPNVPELGAWLGTGIPATG